MKRARVSEHQCFVVVCLWLHDARQVLHHVSCTPQPSISFLTGNGRSFYLSLKVPGVAVEKKKAAL
jgi:hypothetical protein